MFGAMMQAGGCLRLTCLLMAEISSVSRQDGWRVRRHPSCLPSAGGWLPVECVPPGEEIHSQMQLAACLPGI